MSKHTAKGALGAKQWYLVAYNTAQLAGWGSAAYLTLHALVRHEGGDAVYKMASRIVGTLSHVHGRYRGMLT